MKDSGVRHGTARLGIPSPSKQADMKKHQKSLVLTTSLAVAFAAEAVLIPNGDFEDPSGPGTLWVDDEDNDIETVHEFFFFENNGNPGGHAVIDNEFGGGFGVLIANNNEPISLASLGLIPGKRYLFSQDMRFSPESVVGSEPGEFFIGGLKVEFFFGNEACASTGDLFQDLKGDGSTWETYDYEVSIPGGADGMKVVLLWGEESTVSFDNISVDDTPLPDITEIPNGDFEVASGDSWGLNDDGGNALISFPATDGNPDGHAVIDTTNANFGVLISNSDNVIPLSGLGLTAGQTYQFSQDMRIVSGSEIGGLKVEFYTCGIQHSTTGDIYPETDSGSAWDTYNFPISIPPAADGIKVVLLGGSASEVAFDNVTFSPSSIAAPPAIDVINGDFSDLGRNWGRGGEENTVITFSATGGNPGAYAQMDNNGSNFGVLVANADSSIPIERLGLMAGNAYTFSMDTNRVSGSDFAKFKVEFYRRGVRASDTGNLPANTVTNAWVTDDFVVSIPLGTDAIRVVPVAGVGSVIRYDNVTVDPTVVEAPPLSNLDFEEGGIGWAPFTQSNSTQFSFPETGGVDNSGYARMDDNGFSFGVLSSGGGLPTPLSDLGLSPGMNVDLDIDIRLIEGSNIGGVKIEYYSSPNTSFIEANQTQEAFPTPVGDGSEWNTYSFRNLFVPTTTAAGNPVDGIKIVLIAGNGSIVGFDNVTIVTDSEPVTITLTDSGFDASGNYFLEIAEGVSGLIVMGSPDLETAFSPVAGVTDDGANRFTIPAASLDSNSDGADFFRVEEAP